jgi:hypothetical protein
MDYDDEERIEDVKITLTCTRILRKKESSGCHLLHAKSKEICSKHTSGAGNLLS